MREQSLPELPESKYQQLLSDIFSNISLNKKISKINKCLDQYRISWHQKINFKKQKKTLNEWLNEKNGSLPSNEMNSLMKILCTFSYDLPQMNVNGVVITAEKFSIMWDQCDILSVIYSQNPQIFRNKNQKLETLLHFAALYSHSMDIFDFLIKEVKLDLEAETYEGRTPVFLAVEFGNLPALKALHQHGANLRCIDKKQGLDLLYISQIRNNLQKNEIVAYLQKEGGLEIKPLNLMFANIRVDNFKGVKYWRKEIKDINQEAKDGNILATSLFLAAEKGLLTIVEYLLEQKANVNKGANDNSTPFMVAISHSHLNVSKLLLRAKADVNAVNQFGISCLIDAMDQEATTESIKLLLSAKANVNYQTPEGFTALFMAAQKNKSEIITELLKVPSINPNVISKRITPLVWAVSLGKTEAALTLLKFDATDKEAVNEVGFNLTQIALRNNHLVLLEALFKLGIKNKIIFDSPYSLINIAVIFNNYQAWKLLNQYSKFIDLSFEDFTLLLAIFKRIDIKFLKDIIITYREKIFDLESITLFFIYQGYKSFVPFLIPEIKSAKNLSESECAQVIFEYFKNIRQQEGLEEKTKLEKNVVVDSVLSQPSEQKFSGREYLMKELGYGINAIQNFTAELKSNKKEIKPGVSQNIYNIFDQPSPLPTFSWFEGRLKSANLIKIRRSPVPNAYLYIDTTLDSLKEGFPALKALLTQSEWAFSLEHGIKKIKGDYSTHYTIRGEGGEPVKVKITHEITSRSSEVQHQRILLFPVVSGRGVVLIATANLYLEHGLGERVVNLPDLVQISLPAKQEKVCLTSKTSL